MRTRRYYDSEDDCAREPEREEIVHRGDDALEREALNEMGEDPLAGDDVGCK